MKKYKIVFTDAQTINGNEDNLKQFCDFGEIKLYNNLTSAQITEYEPDAEIIVANKTLITADVINNMPHLKLITILATGYNNVDTATAAKRGIPVCNAGQYSTDSVAQHVFSFILNHTNRVGEFDKRVKNGDWEKSEVFCLLDDRMTELKGKTLGIFGYGSIGRKVGEIACAFGMNVIVTTRTKRDDGTHYVSFDELLEKSDFITVHCPLTPQTKKIFNAGAFAKCKSNCMFINTSRGGTVDEQALADALNSGKIAAAAVDVLEKEPMSGSCPLKTAKNITFTPHVAWAAKETRQRLVDIVYKNIEGFVNGNVINKVN